jgi:hypothetical protein
MAERQAESKLGFLDSLAGLVRGKPDEAPAEAPRQAGGFEAVRAGFEAALRDLNEKAAACRRPGPAASTAVSAGRQTAEERAADRKRRIEAVRGAMREDIRSMHARLRTGLESSDLEALAAYLEELAALEDAGKDSHELLPRARFAITERIRAEAGELAVARLVELLQREELSWPDSTSQRRARPEEIETSRRRRLAEIRESFLAQSLARTAERMLGVVGVWGSDYPERGSTLWEETVLGGVAAGIRGGLVKESVELLRRDRDLILERTEASIGKELAALQQVLKAGVTSLEQANQAVASSLRVLDEVVPEFAWEHVRSQLPSARGEWGS